MFEAPIAINQTLLRYAHSLIADLPDERIAEQPVPGVNHPAWILGHLAYSADAAMSLFGAEKTLGPEWERQFGRGSKLTAVRGDYPARDKLIRALDERFEQARQVAAKATTEQTSRRTPNPMFKDVLPTVGDLYAFILTGHLGLHLGQLSTWRRMIGLPALF